MNDPIIEDIEYDELCRELKEKWDSVEHYHKHDELRREAVRKKDGWYFEQLKSNINLIRNTINMLEKIRKKGE